MDQIQVRRAKSGVLKIAAHARCRVEGTGIAERVKGRVKIADILALCLIE